MSAVITAVLPAATRTAASTVARASLVDRDEFGPIHGQGFLDEHDATRICRPQTPRAELAHLAAY